MFGSGVALIAAGRGGGLLLSLHAVSFGVWGVVMVVHVVAYVARTLRLGPADWLPNDDRVAAGVRSRRAVLGGALLAGALLALATHPFQQSWLNHRHEHPHSEASGARLSTSRNPVPR